MRRPSSTGSLSCSARSAAAVLVLAATACGTAGVEPSSGPALQSETERAEHPADYAPSTATAGEDEPVRAAIEALRARDFRAAFERVSALYLESELGQARAELGAGSPEDALIAIDNALGIDAKDRSARLLKASASLALGDKAIAQGKSAALVNGSFEDALRYYRTLGDDPQALLGASRAALALGRYDEALASARSAVERFDAAGIEPQRGADGLDVAPERILAEAAFRAFVVAKQEEPEGARAQELFAESEDALARLLGREQSPWVWRTLVDLYLWQGELESARSQAENGLDREPEDFELIDRLARVAHEQGGPAEMAAAFTAFNARHPDIARGLWYEAQGRLDEATDYIMGLYAEPPVVPEDEALVPSLLRESEALFRRCRSTDATYANACLGYEALTRGGLGWYLVGKERYEDATAAFRSMEEVFAGGMTSQLEGRLLSGVDGLKLIGDRYRDANQLGAAGRVFEFLHAYQPEDVNWANNQGFFLRDAAVELEMLGRSLCAAAKEGTRDLELLGQLAERTGVDMRGVEVANEGALMVRAANAAMDNARSMMQRSYAGYEAAAALSPNDVRVVNDTALILVYYLHEQLDYAEALLRRSIAMGADQSKQDDLTDDQRFELLNAWGDAYQNLGVLYANLLDRTEEAIPFFERAVEIGPEPRPLLSNYWLPRLRGESIAGEDPTAPKTWAEPCAE